MRGRFLSYTDLGLAKAARAAGPTGFGGWLLRACTRAIRQYPFTYLDEKSVDICGPPGYAGPLRGAHERMCGAGAAADACGGGSARRSVESAWRVTGPGAAASRGAGMDLVLGLEAG